MAEGVCVRDRKTLQSCVGLRNVVLIRIQEVVGVGMTPMIKKVLHWTEDGGRVNYML